MYKTTTDQKLYAISLLAYLSRIMLVNYVTLGTATKLSETEKWPLKTFKGPVIIYEKKGEGRDKSWGGVMFIFWYDRGWVIIEI